MSRTVLLKWGKMPHIVRAGKARLALALGTGDFKVYALATSGARVRDVQCAIKDGRVGFVADVASTPDNATFLYEIVRCSEKQKENQ